MIWHRYVFLYVFLFNNHFNIIVQKDPEPMCEMDHTEQAGETSLVCDMTNM